MRYRVLVIISYVILNLKVNSYALLTRAPLELYFSYDLHMFMCTASVHSELGSNSIIIKLNNLTSNIA